MVDKPAQEDEHAGHRHAHKMNSGTERPRFQQPGVLRFVGGGQNRTEAEFFPDEARHDARARMAGGGRTNRRLADPPRAIRDSLPRMRPALLTVARTNSAPTTSCTTCG